MTTSFELIAIGASAGGVTAIQSIAAILPENFDTPIAVVQHVRAAPRIDLGLVYRTAHGVRVFEVEDKMPIERRAIYMAPPDYHLLVERDGSFSLSQDDPVHFSRPSIDVFFESVAFAYGPRALGILLTGANADGAAGLAAMSRAGAETIVQKPSDAEFATMPEAALKLFEPDRVLTLSQLRTFVLELSSSQASIGGRP
jgi:two-component system, chemotaxis family, protein-glutamate methylesterase/glutaminase